MNEKANLCLGCAIQKGIIHCPRVQVYLCGHRLGPQKEGRSSTGSLSPHTESWEVRLRHGHCTRTLSPSAHTH